MKVEYIMQSEIYEEEKVLNDFTNAFSRKKQSVAIDKSHWGGKTSIDYDNRTEITKWKEYEHEGEKGEGKQRDLETVEICELSWRICCISILCFVGNPSSMANIGPQIRVWSWGKQA